MSSKNRSGFTAIEALLIVVIVSVLGGAGWFVWHSKNNADKNYNNASASSTPAKYSTKKSSGSTQKSASPPSTPPPVPASLKENAAASIESKNTAALEGYFASSVHVVIAASEHAVNVTPTQAITEVDYVSGGTSPWNFSLDSATLTSYKNGSYGSYFGTNTIVGKSANNYVISFGVNSAGKIDTVFMTNMASVLTD